MIISMCVMNSIVNTSRTNKYNETGILFLQKEEQDKKRRALEKNYKFAYESAKENAKERYSINYSSISHFIDLAEGLAINDVKQGIEMQNSKGPQHDWAIIGGAVSGVAGGFAGAMAAADTMRKNAEATERYHAQGRKLVEQGLSSYNNLEVSKSKILSGKYDGLVFSKPNPHLINELSAELLDSTNYGVGYFEADVKIEAKRDYNFPSGSNGVAAIDGSVRVDIYDKEDESLLAYGYYCPPGRFGNDLTKTGFGSEDKKTIVMKEQYGKSFNKHKDYIIKLSEPNLWLLQIK